MTKPGSKAISSPQSPHHRRLPPTSPSPALGRARGGAATADPVTAGGRESSPWLWAGRWAGGEGPCSPALCSHPSSGANSSDPAAGAADTGCGPWLTDQAKRTLVANAKFLFFPLLLILFLLDSHPTSCTVARGRERQFGARAVKSSTSDRETTHPFTAAYFNSGKKSFRP